MYRGLEAETGQAVDWHETGSLRLACSPERVMELRRLTTMAKSFGLPMEIISPQRAQELFPLMSTEDVLAAAFLPTDGYIDPASVTQAIARGRAHARRTHQREHGGHVDHGRRPSGHHRAHRQRRRDRVRDGGQRGRHVGHGGRPHGRGTRARHRGRAPVHAERSDRGLHAGRAGADADDARPRSSRLLQARRTGAAGRRVRTRHRSRSARRASRRRSSASCSIRTSTASRSWPSWPPSARRSSSRPASAA